MSHPAETTKTDEKNEAQEFKEEMEKAIKALTLKEKVRAVALLHHLEKKKALDEELEKELKELHLKYEKKSLPIYTESQSIITGERAATEEELKTLDTYLNDEEKGKKNEVIGHQEPIAEYWLKAFQNSDIISAEVKEHDEEVLKHLTKIEYKPEENGDNFTIICHFSENPYFTNQTLTKKFAFKDEEPEVAEGTEINWKEGKNITKKTVKKTQKNKKSGAKRVISKEVDAESFFNFFKTSKADDEDHEGHDHDDDEEGHEHFDERIHIDYDIARTLIDEIIPYSLEYYLGVKEEEGDFEDDEDDLGDIDEEDLEEEEEEKPKKGGNKKKQHKKSTDSAGGKEGGKEEKPECKQQ